MEKDVEKLYDDVINDINCENDEFINNYFSNDDFEEESFEDKWKNDDLYGQLPESSEIKIVENYVENVGKEPEIQENKDETIVENFENEFNNKDLESLLTSSINFDNELIVDQLETNVDVTAENIVEPDELNIVEKHITQSDNLEQTTLEPEELTTDDILELIEKTDNSEEFFEKIEDQLND